MQRRRRALLLLSSYRDRHPVPGREDQADHSWVFSKAAVELPQRFGPLPCVRCIDNSCVPPLISWVVSPGGLDNRQSSHARRLQPLIAVCPFPHQSNTGLIDFWFINRPFGCGGRYRHPARPPLRPRSALAGAFRPGVGPPAGLSQRVARVES